APRFVQPPPAPAVRRTPGPTPFPAGRRGVIVKPVPSPRPDPRAGMPSDSDRLLIQQIRQGDPRAWDALIARYEGRLLAFVQRRLRDGSASEDVVQETFVGSLNSLPNFDDRRELQTYLFTIAAHKLTDHLRRSGRHPLRPLSEGGSDLLNQQLDPNPG